MSYVFDPGRSLSLYTSCSFFLESSSSPPITTFFQMSAEMLPFERLSLTDLSIHHFIPYYSISLHDIYAIYNILLYTFIFCLLSNFQHQNLGSKRIRFVPVFFIIISPVFRAQSSWYIVGIQ